MVLNKEYPVIKTQQNKKINTLYTLFKITNYALWFKNT